MDEVTDEETGKVGVAPEFCHLSLGPEPGSGLEYVTDEPASTQSLTPLMVATSYPEDAPNLANVAVGPLVGVPAGLFAMLYWNVICNWW